MSDLALSFHVALELIIGLDADLVEIVLLSLRITLTALLIAVIVGLPLKLYRRLSVSRPGSCNGAL